MGATCSSPPRRTRYRAILSLVQHRAIWCQVQPSRRNLHVPSQVGTTWTFVDWRQAMRCVRSQPLAPRAVQNSQSAPPTPRREHGMTARAIERSDPRRRLRMISAQRRRVPVTFDLSARHRLRLNESPLRRKCRLRTYRKASTSALLAQDRRASTRSRLISSPLGEAHLASNPSVRLM